MDDVQEKTGGSHAGRPVSCSVLTVGQYLQPTRNHLPIERWVSPAIFESYRTNGLAKGFRVVESGPLVRSSYHAEEQADRLNPDQADVQRRMSALIALGRERRVGTTEA
jgi:hypothetical protein